MKISRITPMLPVRSMPASIEFYLQMISRVMFGSLGLALGRTWR